MVELGIQVVAEVALALEAPFAVGAVSVHVTIVVLALCVVVEILLIMCFRRFICPVVEGQSATDLFAWPTSIVVFLCMIP